MATKFAIVKYGRVSNLGSYESERAEVEVVVEGGCGKREAQAALAEAKRFVHAELGLEDELTPEQYAKARRAIASYERRNGSK